MIKAKSHKRGFQIKETPLFWPAYVKGGTLYVLDETLIPNKQVYIKVKNTKQSVQVIRTMKTRAFGQFLVVLNTFLLEINRFKGQDSNLVKRIKETAIALNKSRPTFPFSEVTGIVVSWAEAGLKDEQNLKQLLQRNINGYLNGIRYRRLERIKKVASLIKHGDSILTHCNVSGELAMAAYMCRSQGKDIHVFATETRPYLQGAKLTVWELSKMGIHVTLIADSAIGSVMEDGLVDKVIVGSDRSCANGDFANKIGTYQIAVLANEYKIPFYVLTQPSKKVKKGSDIPIEIRDEDELLKFKNKRIVPKSVKGFYPGFDVIPKKYITSAVAIDVN